MPSAFDESLCVLAAKEIQGHGEDGHPSGPQLVLEPLAAFPELELHRRLQLRSERLGCSYRLCDGRYYRVFRETARALPDA